MRRPGGCGFPYTISRSAIRTASRKPVTALAPVLNPHGVLSLKPSDDGSASNSVHDTRLEQAFVRGSGHGLLYLGADEVGTSLPPVLAYWREFAARYVTALCALPGLARGASEVAVPVPADEELNRLAAAVPPMTGAEYLTPRSWPSSGAPWMRPSMPSWREAKVIGSGVPQSAAIPPGIWSGACISISPRTARTRRRRSPSSPPTRRGCRRRPRRSICRSARRCRNMPARKNRERLLSLLMPVQRAAEQCGWLKTMVDAGEIYHPLRWTPAAGAAIPEGRAGARSAPAWSCGCRRAGA